MVTFTQASGPGSGSQADECLVTVKPAVQNSGSTGWMLNVLAAEMTEFVGARKSRKESGSVSRTIERNPPLSASLLVDGHLLEGWTIVANSVTGIAVKTEDRAMLWIGLGEARPPRSIFTAETSSIFIS